MIGVSRMEGRKKKILIILLLIGILSIGSISIKYDLLSIKKVEATNISDTLNNMGNNSLINKLLNNQIRQVEDEKTATLLEEKREILEAQRIEEEKERIEQEILALENDPNSRFAYLTFDDGPSINSTPAILDILKEYEIKATFFVLGSNAEKHPDILKRIRDEGHKIGNHSYSHVYGYIYRNTRNFMEDISRADGVLKDILGEDFETKLLRLPGGSFGKYKAPMVKAAENEGYTIYDWNSLNGDAEGYNLKNSYLTRRLRETTMNKKNAIILMHDMDSKVGTVETLRENIDYLISQGFYFRVLEENNDD